MFLNHRVLRILRYCFSKIVYLFYYHDVAHSFIHGDFSAYKKTPNKSCKKYSDNNLEFNKNFNNLFRDEERSPLHPDKKINFNLFHQESKNLRNMKIFLCNFYNKYKVFIMFSFIKNTIERVFR